jgi:ketol-acid reductoisomerase
MATIYHENDGDLKWLKGKTVSVLGFGNQGSAQAMNMRDSGVKVVVGNTQDAYFDMAVADGFEAFEIPEAVKRADFHILLITDEVMPHVFDKDIRPFLKPGQAIVVSSGYNVAYGFLRCPSEVDVLMIAPRTIGTAVRKTYLSGKGFASLVGVHHDATGHAKQVMLALAKAIGTLKCAGIDSSCEEETLCDLFNEQSGGLYAWRRAYELLVEAGASPEAAMLEFWASGELSDVAEVIQTHGLFGQVKFHSLTSQYGQEVTGRHSTKEEEEERGRLRGIIARIKDGTFAKEWTLEQQAGYPTLNRVHQQNMAHSMTPIEERLLREMGFWKKG